MKSRAFGAGTLAAALAAAHLVYPAAARAAHAPPAWCAPGPGLRAGSLPPVVELRRCDLRGRVVTGSAGAAVTVPRYGGSAAAHVLRADGPTELEVRVDSRTRTATVRERRPGSPEAGPRSPGERLRASGGQAPTTAAACSDRAHRLGPGHWRRGSRVTWHYHPGTVKDSGLSARRAVRAVRHGVAGAFGVRTDCVQGATSFGREPNIAQRYAGTTRARPGISDAGACRDRDGVNSFGWAALPRVPPDALAVTCLWHTGGVIRESDMALQTRGKRWWTPRAPRRGGPQPVPGCPHGRYEAVSVVTHETLHVLGLRHIEGKRHENLSMSPYVRPCDDRAATLGAGDHRGLLKLYGARRSGAVR